MLQITAHLLTKDNQSTIRESIISIKEIVDEIIVCDLGSSDHTTAIANELGCVIQRSSLTSRSDIRNQMVASSKNDWQLYLEPWEIFPNEPEVLLELIKSNNAYNFNILSQSLITREVRLWNKKLGYKFVNPVMEFLDCHNEINSNLMVIEKKHKPIDYCNEIAEWAKSKPNDSVPLYYACCQYIKKQQWDLFKSTAVKYLFMNATADMPAVMIKYYLATVRCHIDRDANLAIKDILACIAIKPLVSEFWCLLADVYYYLINDYIKAERLYKNAMILGSKREIDTWPIDIVKYHDYPERMVQSCRSILSQSLYLRP